MTRTFMILTPIVFAAACASPKANTATRADFRAAEADGAFADTLDFTPVDQIPAGSATYRGNIYSDAIVQGVDDFKVLGDLELSLNFSDDAARAGSSNISGTIDNLNLFDDASDGFDDQGLSGSLAVSGRAEAGRVEATATGVIGAVVADTFGEPTATWQLDLDGDVYDNFENGDVIAGDVTGGTTGAPTDDYTLVLTGDGGFYTERGD